MLKRNANGKSGFMRFISQMMAVLLVIATVLTVSPGVTKADAGEVLSSAKLTLSSDYKTLTVSFNVYAFPVNDVGNLKNSITIYRNYNSGKSITGDSALNSLNMSDDGKIIIQLDQPLVPNNILLQIPTGILKSKDNIISNQFFSFGWFNPQYSNINIDRIFIDTTKKVLTATFTNSIDSNEVNLKDFIQLSTDNGESYEPLANADTALIANDRLIISLNTPLEGTTNRIKILAGSLTNRSQQQYNVWLTLHSNLESESIDISPTELISTEVLDAHSMQLNFNRPALINSNLKAMLSYSSNGVDFVPFPTDVNLNAYYANDQTKIKIDQNYFDFRNKTIKFAAESFNGTPEIKKSLSFSLQSATLSNDNKDVLLTFDGDVSSYTEDLKDNVQYSENGNYDLRSLGTDDTVSIENGKLKVHVADGLKGESIVIYVESYSLINSNGVILTTDTVTNNLKALTDLTGPRLIRPLIKNKNKDIVLEFDENIALNKITLDELKNLIAVNNNNDDDRMADPVGNVSLTDATISILNKSLTIHFETPLDSYYYNVSIPAGSLKDELGNVASAIYAYNIYKPNLIEPSLNYYYLSHNNHWLNINFNSESYLIDNTLDDAGVSSLHDSITISTDGTSFHALAPDDIVTFKDSRITVFFKSGQNDSSLYFNIAAGALADLAGNVQTTDLISEKLNSNKPDFTGNFYSNAPSEFLFEDNVTWRNKIETVSISEDTNEDWASRVLNPTEYSILAGKIVINPSVFKHGTQYELQVMAEGYSRQYASGISISPNETYFMTAPILSSKSGLTATVNVLNTYDLLNSNGCGECRNSNNNGSNHNATMVFVLLNGSTPVSIVAQKQVLTDGEYTAYFNVPDATNPNYSVKAFIVNKYSNDPENIGLNLAVVKTQNELDQAQNDYEYND